MHLQVAAFSGSGVRFPAYVGAVKALAEAKQLDSIHTILGTSGGAIISLAVALGFSINELEKLALELNYKTLISDDAGLVTELIDLERGGALFKAKHLLTKIESFIAEKTGNPNTTFSQLNNLKSAQPEKGFRHLIVTAINMNAQNNPLTFFSHTLTPDIRLADAVFASACAPLYIMPHQFDFPMSDGMKPCYFVDGGVGMNDPISLYLNHHAEKPHLYEVIINFIIGTKASLLDTKTYRPFNPGLTHNTIEQLETLMTVSEYIPLNNPKLAGKTVFIDPLGIGPFDLEISLPQKENLLASGFQATQQFLQDNLVEEATFEPIPVFGHCLTPSMEKFLSQDSSTSTLTLSTFPELDEQAAPSSKPSADQSASRCTIL